ncbi:MAG: cytochrome c, partial [Planctomycetia bacterium]|nr:cytochrome c [Planctomycetia bacterium]
DVFSALGLRQLLSLHANDVGLELREDFREAGNETELIAAADRCGSCHNFRDNGTGLGTAPDLTGWGGREWIAGIVANPADERFYGDGNDRMPAFEKLLSTEQIGLIADWLRGTWYRSGTGRHDATH